MRRTIASRLMSFGPSALLLVLAGCGKAAPTADIEWAKSTVESALASWKQGRRPELLQKLSPPVQFQDQDWQQALKLQDYTVKEVTAQDDGLLRCQVHLSVQDHLGKSVEKEIVYIVDRPKGVIGRDPYF